MTNAAFKRTVLLVFLVSGTVAAFPVKPPGKMTIAAGELAVLSVVLFALCVHDTVRRTSSRLAIPLVWLLMALGFGSLSVGLRTMAQSWGLRSGQLPITSVTIWLAAGMLCLTAGIAGLTRAFRATAE